MNFRDTPDRYLRTPRTTRKAPMEACAIEQPAPKSAGHRLVPVACVLMGLFVLIFLALENFA